mmetsp:Transcript_57066/g.152487  ORF Transcript_57066/g.152487 Transcript_57066/m.152487 type:complete len:256 (-) Transcript_57066:281-1048(-)
MRRSAAARRSAAFPCARRSSSPPRSTLASTRRRTSSSSPACKALQSWISPSTATFFLWAASMTASGTPAMRATCMWWSNSASCGVDRQRNLNLLTARAVDRSTLLQGRPHSGCMSRTQPCATRPSTSSGFSSSTSAHEPFSRITTTSSPSVTRPSGSPTSRGRGHKSTPPTAGTPHCSVITKGGCSSDVTTGGRRRPLAGGAAGGGAEARASASGGGPGNNASASAGGELSVPGELGTAAPGRDEDPGRRTRPAA